MMEEKLNEIFDELLKEAYNAEYHTYDYKLTNQIIRKHFERLVRQPGPQATPKIAQLEKEFYELFVVETENSNVFSEYRHKRKKIKKHPDQVWKWIKSNFSA